MASPRLGSARDASPLAGALRDLRAARDREHEIKKRLVFLTRSLEKNYSGDVAKQIVAERNRRAGEMLRAFKDELFHRNLAREMADEPRATLSEITQMSLRLNASLSKIVPAWETPSWFKLFRYVDADGSGLISFAEFVDMVRDVLKLSEMEMPEPRLKALWLALDADCSGYLTSGEFGSFFRLGEPNADRVAAAKQFVADRNRAAGDLLREEKDKLFHRHLAREMENEPRASVDELREVSALLNVAQRSIVRAWETPSWFKLFRHVDSDGSGLISYAEFVDMVRDVLKLHDSDLPEKRLKAIWLALDDDCSGYLTSGEFGAFFRLGEPPQVRVSPLEMRREIAISARHELETELAEDTRLEAKKVRRDLAQPERRNLQLASKLRNAPLGYRRHGEMRRGGIDKDGTNGNGIDGDEEMENDEDDLAMSIEEWLEREYARFCALAKRGRQ